MPTIEEAIDEVVQCGKSLIAKGHTARETILLIGPMLKKVEREALLDALMAATGVDREQAAKYYFYSIWRPGQSR